MVEFRDYLGSKYNKFYEFSEGLATVRNIHNLYGFINQKGEEVIPCKYKSVESFRDGLALVEENGLYGFIDNKENEIVSCKYKWSESFHEGLAIVENSSELWGFINKEGREVIPCRYESAGNFSEGLAAVCENNKWGYIDKKGKVKIPFEYIFANDFSDGLAFVNTSFHDGDQYSINKNNERVINYLYFKGDVEFHEDLAKTSNFLGLIGFIDKKGQNVIPYKYRAALPFSEGLAAVQNIFYDWGYVNKEGKEVIPCKYEKAQSFNEGLAVVMNEKEKYGYIDKTGKKVLPAIYNYADSFNEGLAYVNLNDYDYYIDRLGNRTIGFKHLYKTKLIVDNKEIFIEADTKKEFNDKKIKILKELKQKYMNQLYYTVQNLQQSDDLLKKLTKKK